MSAGRQSDRMQVGPKGGRSRVDRDGCDVDAVVSATNSDGGDGSDGWDRVRSAHNPEVAPTGTATGGHEWLVGRAALAWADFGHT